MVRTPCCKAEGLKKGAWHQEEDEKLIAYLQRHDEGGWRTLPQRAGLNRCGKSCRLRWANYLRPGIKRGEFSQEEDESIINLHAIHGNKWSAIARRLHGRTDNEIKNHWNTQIKKRLVKKGIDPLSHKRLEKSNIHHHQEEENVQNSNNINLLRSSSSRFLNTVANRFGKTINHNVFSNIIGSGVLLTNHIPSASECERSTKSSITPTSLNLILNQNIIVDAPSLSSSTVSESSDPLKYDNICSDVEDITGFSSNFLSGVVSHNDEEFLMLDDSFLEDTLFMRELTMILEKDKIETTSFSDSHLNMAGMPITEVDDSFEGIKNYFG